MQWFAQAPSNIALIKYMGKKDEVNNIPMNASLSYTLNQLVSNVVLESYQGKQDLWEPLDIPGRADFKLSMTAQARYLAHLARLKDHFKYKGAFIVRSSNNFPHSSGIASSASSFAALTKCAVMALSELTQKPMLAVEEQAKLSRLGSGSSCRSFFSPWAIWQDEIAESIELPYAQLDHQVIVVSHNEKDVPSSEAHQRIKLSPLYATRAQRATENLKVLLDALRTQNWSSASQICWREFQDMHQMFPSCAQPFTYITEGAEQALTKLQSLWQQEGDGPLVTMDAGPNIHLLYRPDQAEMALKFKHDHLINNYDVL